MMVMTTGARPAAARAAAADSHRARAGLGGGMVGGTTWRSVERREFLVKREPMPRRPMPLQ